ncbi:MAG: Uma2 family endonuclease [Pyrinomonadaceae bacterium]|nr:Uma2 family endonuclease [Phycisphaerales bacterium]
MSAAPRWPSEYGYAGLRMSAQEYLALGETQDHYELINGVVCMSPKPTPRHQKIIQAIQRQLERFIDANPGFQYFLDSDVRFSDNTVYEPDLSCYRPGRVSAMPRHLSEVPDLIIEILSPGTRAFDLTVKKDDYERYGVSEYWAIDPADARVRCYRRQGELLIESPVITDSLASTALPGFVLDVVPLRTLAQLQ